MLNNNCEIVHWNKENETQIDNYVDLHLDGLIYYKSIFKNFLLRIFKAHCISVVFYENKKITGILPLLLKDGCYGKVINSLPFFGSNGGILSITDKANKALYDYYENVSNGSDISLSVLISHPFKDIKVPQYDFIDERIAQWTNIQPPYSNGLSINISSSAKRNIAKAVSKGVVVREDSNALNFLEETHKENILGIGGRIKPNSFFSELKNSFIYGKDWKLFIAEYQGIKIAGLLIFQSGTTVEYIMPVVKKEYRNIQPTSVIIEYAMIDAKNNGFKKWNWGGTWTSQEGVYRFKKKWGAEERKYSYYVKLNNKKFLNLTPEVLNHEYPFFYTIPYNYLKG